MSQYFVIHPTHPQGRLLHQAADIVRGGGVIVYPTDSTYALACQIGDKDGLDRIRAIRRLDKLHHFTLVCRDLSELSNYARVDNASYRILKRLTPGPFTFLLRASKEVPRRLVHPKRKTIGLRVPDHPVAQGLLEALGEPLMSTSLILPGEVTPLSEPEDFRARLERQVDLIIDGGAGGLTPTTVVDLTESEPQVIRVGLGVLE
ncbi:MAG: threonylcarbamoyl-AMP synthase [Gammaproteobacteria bacterium]|nr:threonylcarbamoyl-AMP synthase [Gammaproteobacteria bacterium]